MLRVYSFLIVYFFVNALFAQKQNIRSRSDLGVLVGGAYYIGDLNQLNHFQNTNLTYGLIYRYNANSRVSLRANLTYGNLKASDAQATNSVLINRNLSFQTDFYEFASGIEFNFAPYKTGDSKNNISPYIFVEMGFFKMNPKTNFNGDLIELQPLGTEGQGTDLSKKDFYSKTQFCLPLGVGCKFSVSKNMSFNIEYALRKTFTDYIDDVGSNRYIDRAALSAINGPLVGELSNRSLDGSSQGLRGNSSTKDWYFVFGGILTYRLGPADKCSFRN